jgi:hypothetical protein
MSATGNSRSIVGHALRQVIGDDFPEMMRELTPLRPDLL